LTAAQRLDNALASWRVVRFEAIDSTNEEARRRALAGDPGRIWILADQQTEGRGRRARAWISPRGNLHASALLIDPCPAAIAPQLGFVAGVALARAARDIGAAKAGLKWPNDLMSGGAKCAGILIEGLGLAGRRAAYVVGIGVNCAEGPAGLDYPTTCLTREVGRAVSPGELFERLAIRFDETLDAWRAGEAFEGIRAAWLDCALGVGERIEIESGDAKREGVLEGVDAHGRLMLRGDCGLEIVEAADLRILPASSDEPPAAPPGSRVGGGGPG
jgi:BirA family transcriptional regulator, biotin operon repressor / biotin---[acetyl-CoA-carboxylase] ligase